LRAIPATRVSCSARRKAQAIRSSAYCISFLGKNLLEPAGFCRNCHALAGLVPGGHVTL
jgi:hypothetical protein